MYVFIESVQVHGSGDYDSDFSDEDQPGESSEGARKRLNLKLQECIVHPCILVIYKNVLITVFYLLKSLNSLLVNDNGLNLSFSLNLAIYLFDI